MVAFSRLYQLTLVFKSGLKWNSCSLLLSFPMISLLTQQDMHTIYWSLPIDACVWSTDYGDYHVLQPLLGYIVAGSNTVERCDVEKKSATFMDFINIQKKKIKRLSWVVSLQQQQQATAPISM